MYTFFHNLNAKPFGFTPDPRFLHMAEPHRIALTNVVEVAVKLGLPGNAVTPSARTALEESLSRGPMVPVPANVLLEAPKLNRATTQESS